jgi:chromosome segregation ATPase
MPNAQPIEVSVAVINEQLKTITEDMREARAARKAQYEQSERQNTTLTKIEHRLEKVETWITASDPTIAEYRTFRAQAQGAGTLGKWVWALAMASIGAVATLVATWQRWLGN